MTVPGRTDDLTVDGVGGAVGHTPRAARGDRGARWVSFALLSAILLVYAFVVLQTSARKPLWIDEIFTWEGIQTPWATLVLKGPPDETNHAPLNFVISRLAYQVRGAVRYLGLTPLQYFRLHALLIFVVVCFAALRTRLLHGGFGAALALIVGLLPFLFDHLVLRYMTEMRFYGLWVVLSLAVLLAIENAVQHPMRWLLCILALCWTTTASSVQMITLLASIVIAAVWCRSLPLRALVLDPRVLAILLGMGLAGYYSLYTPGGFSFRPRLSQFLAFWAPLLPWLGVGVVVALHHLRNRAEGRAAACLTACAWLASGPLVFLLIHWKSYYVAERQLLFMHAAVVLIVFEALRSAWFGLRPGRMRTAAVGTILTLMVLHIATRLPDPDVWRQPSRPHGWEIVEARIPHQIPARAELLRFNRIPRQLVGGWWKVKALNRCGQTNYELWWDYLQERYPPERFPRDADAALVARCVVADRSCPVPCVTVELVRID